MTRKSTRNYSLSVVALFFALLTLLIAPTALAQTQRPLKPSSDVVGSSPAVSAQTKPHGARPTNSNSPLFLPAVTYDSGGYSATFVAVGDVNGDGKLDVAVANFLNGTVGVLLGKGDGTFQPAVTYYAGGQSVIQVAIADLNRDGKPDLVAANSWGNIVAVLLGNGDGTFQPLVTYGAGIGPASVSVADVNGDGNLDLLVADEGGNTVAVLLGNGDGTFQPALTFASGGSSPMSVGVADVNGDGKPDLVVANYCSTACDYPPTEGSVGVLLGNGDGTFQPAVVYDSGGTGATSIAIADVNGDGRPDVLVADEGYDAVAVLLGNGDGTFQPAVLYGTGGNAFSVAFADVNGDNKPDVVVANCGSVKPDCFGSYSEGSVAVLLGNGDGTLQAAIPFDSGGIMATAVAIADVNGDGRPDLLAANFVCITCTGTVGVLLNNTGPHTPSATTLTSSKNPATVRYEFVYTAAVTSEFAGAAAGTVTFQDGGATIATVSLAGNQASCRAKYNTTGIHTITASYSGDLHNLASTSGVLTEVIGDPSLTVVATSGSPSFVGQAVTFTATVTSTDGAIPDGEPVAFYDGTTMLASVGLVGGTAAYTTSALSAKTHTIKATYAGDATFLPSTGSAKQVVNKYSTTTALSSSPNPSAYGQAVTFMATLTSAGPVPTGNVRFKDGTSTIGSALLSGGVATLTKPKLAVGTHAITAQYLGDAVSAASTSPVLDQVVQ